MESINSLLQLLVNKFRFENVCILLNLWLIILDFLGIISVLFINLIEFIKFDFKSTFDFLLIDISVSEGFLQVGTSRWESVAAICLNSVQAVLWLLLSWNT